MSDDSCVSVKRPSLQFYPADWRGDPSLRLCSVAARGLWIEMICIMHDGVPYGHLTVQGRAIAADALARLVGESAKDVRRWLKELGDNEVYAVDDDGVIYSRRMVRDEGVRARRAAAGAAGAEHGIKGAEHGAKGAAHGAKGGRPRADNPPHRGANNPPLGDGETGGKTPAKTPSPSSSSSTSSSKGSIQPTNVPDADAAGERGGGWQHERLAVCSAAGMSPDAAAEPEAIALLDAWLGDGVIDIDALLDVVRAVLVVKPGVTNSLKRFDKAVRDAKARALAGRSPKKDCSAGGACVIAGEPPEAERVRQAWLGAVGEAKYRAWCEALTIEADGKDRWIYAPSAFHLEHVETKLGFDLVKIAAGADNTVDWPGFAVQLMVRGAAAAPVAQIVGVAQ